MITLPSVEVQNRFGSIANIVKGGEPVVVTQYGTPTMMILPFAVAQSALHAYRAQTMAEFMREMKPANPDAPDLSMAEITSLVHQLR